VIGPYDAPKVRLPGSGGACEIAMNAQRTFIIMRLKKRAFVERLDFLTSPGHLDGGDARKRLGMRGEGPAYVISDMALFDFENPVREMQLVSLHPGVTVEQVRSEIGWGIRLAREIGETLAPTEEELWLIRDELDPEGMYR
ncbi:MAG: CoA-transferase, partial [Ardenticatenaceae bacterium]